jgi:small GTP-binding protein
MVNLIFWDIAGQIDFKFLNPLFYKESRGGIIVCSLEENDLGHDSFTHIENWHKELVKYCGEIPVVLFANKVDLIEMNDINTIQIQEVVHKYNLLRHFITSAKTGEGVIEAFNVIIETLYYKSKEISNLE